MIDRDRVIFGCGNFGGIGSSPLLAGKGDDRATAFRLLDRARESGIRRFDTANTYGQGDSERMLGAWLREQGPAYRDEIEIASKVGNPNGCPPGRRPLEKAQIVRHLDTSLERLGIDRIDLYYLHEMDESTPFEETFAALGDAWTQGKIGAIGLSNVELSHLRAAEHALPEDLPLIAVQNSFNLLGSGDKETIMPECTRLGVDYVAYGPLAAGILSGQYPLIEGALTAYGTPIDPFVTPANEAILEALRVEAREKAMPMAALTLRLTLEAPGVGAAVVAPRQAQHFTDYGL